MKINISGNFLGNEMEERLRPVAKGARGEQGEKGEPFKYEDFTAEQLEALRGPQGEVGPKGDTGERGEAFTYDDFTEEQLALLKGPKGDSGEKGETGPQGVQGPKGDKGDTGAGFKVIDYYESLSALQSAVPAPAVGDAYGVGTAEPYDIYIYGETSGWVNNGPLQGAKGETGEKGADGVSVTHSWDGTTLNVTSASGTSSADLKGDKGDAGEKGQTGPQGDKGEDGYTPVKGTDYFTDDDVAEIVEQVTANMDAPDISGVINRTTNVNAADTNYTTLMARGTKLMDATTFDAVTDWSTELVNGAIAWRYE